MGRLNADGSVDAAFGNPGMGPSGYVQANAFALQPDGKVLAAGGFVELRGQQRKGLGRLNADGSLDSTFDPGANGSVVSLAVQPDGKIVVGGIFTALAGRACTRLGRLNTDGTLDSGFTGGANGSVATLAVQADGKILVGGGFTAIAGKTRNRIARLNADGSLDTAFDPGANDFVRSLAVQTDGKILVGGWFTLLGGQPRNHIARVNADGSLDLTFNPESDGAVLALTLQADGKILAGGEFTRIGGQPRNYIARLNNTEPATQTLVYDGSAVNWLRGGTSPEAWRTTFEHSVDDLNWTSLGSGTRISGGWQLMGASVPLGSTIRARGYVVGTHGSFVESKLLVADVPNTPPAILINDTSFGVISNHFGFKVSGSAGQVVVVETSSDFSDWTPTATNRMGVATMYFKQPFSGEFRQRYYRLRLGL